MAKRGRGKLRTALANHQARAQQRKAERQHAEAAEAAMKRKSASVRSKAPSERAALAPARHVRPFARDDTVLLVGEGT